MRWIIVVTFLTGLLWGQNSPQIIWSLDSAKDLDKPESVYYDVDSNFLFISNVVGKATEKDGRGWIHKVSLDGQVLKTKWIAGLNAPKGMRAKNGILWVTDIDRVVGINIEKGIIIDQIGINGAKFLNDIVISDGIMYVSDTYGNTIYQIDQLKDVEVFATGDYLECPNGLLVYNQNLVVAAMGTGSQLGRVYTLSLTNKKKVSITQKPLGTLDGIEMDADGNYLVSSWDKNGKVFQITSQGEIITLISGLGSPADIGWVASQKLLVVPVMMSNQVKAFKLGK